jgi:hypothetical protein
MNATRRPEVARADALALPLVAFRGLWDKFAGPCSLGALRRAYSRGVPSLVRCGDGGLDISDVLALVMDPAVNRRQQPVYFVTTARSVPVVGGLCDEWADILTIPSDDASDTAWLIQRWSGKRWTAAGRYLPTAAGRRELTCEDLSVAGTTASLVLFESVNVVGDLSAPLGREADDALLASIQALAPTARLLRVSDLVEGDQLAQRIREAA